VVPGGEAEGPARSGSLMALFSRTGRFLTAAARRRPAGPLPAERGLPWPGSACHAGTRSSARPVARGPACAPSRRHRRPRSPAGTAGGAPQSVACAWSYSVCAALAPEPVNQYRLTVVSIWSRSTGRSVHSCTFSAIQASCSSGESARPYPMVCGRLFWIARYPEPSVRNASIRSRISLSTGSFSSSQAGHPGDERGGGRGGQRVVTTCMPVTWSAVEAGDHAGTRPRPMSPPCTPYRS